MRGCLQKAKLSAKTMATFKKNEFTWRLILSLGRDPATKRWKQQWVTFHGTKTQAEAKLRALTGQVDRGEYIEPSKLTLAQYLEQEWLPKQRAKRGDRTYEVYRNIVQTHVKPSPLGHILLQRVTPSDIEHYHSTKSQLSVATLRLHHTVLSSAFALAKRDGKVRDNVARDAERPTRPRQLQKPKAWSQDETRKVLDAAERTGKQVAAFFALALDSGARKGELLGLRWTDVDLVAHTIRIERQLMEGGSQPVFGPTKTGNERTVSICDRTVLLLKDHKREQAELKLANRLHYADHGLVFAQTFENRGELGTPIPLATLARMLEKLIRETRVTRINVHGLRHTCATLLLAAGERPNVVAERLGHSKTSMTMDVYVHSLPSQQEDAARRMGAVLFG
jgi:integrase